MSHQAQQVISQTRDSVGRIWCQFRPGLFARETALIEFERVQRQLRQSREYMERLRAQQATAVGVETKSADVRRWSRGAAGA